MAKRYAENYALYARLGWKPIPVRGKQFPVPGATGQQGTVTPDQMQEWQHLGEEFNNLGLRAEGWISIDVDDNYGDKRGAADLEDLVKQVGKALPKTFTSTARDPQGKSRQHVYRIADPTLELQSKPRDSIELVQRHHRFMVCWPSIHPSTGTPYTWYDLDGDPMSEPPSLDEIPYLPAEWVQHLAVENGELLDVDVIPAKELLDTFLPEPPCESVQRFITRIETQHKRSHIGHDDYYSYSLQGMMLGREGHKGAIEALTLLRKRFSEYVRAARPQTARTEIKNTFEHAAVRSQQKPLGDVCQCDGVTETALARVFEGEISLGPELLLRERGHLQTQMARETFMNQHPLKRYKDSNGVVFAWVNDRWKEIDLYTVAYRWLSDQLGNQMSKRLAEELYTAALAYADPITQEDVSREYISVENGLLNWETGELRPRTPDVFVVNHLPVAWAPDSTCDKVDEWMSNTLKEEMVPHAWELIGYAISPRHDLKVALAFSGAGGGGKSTFINIMSALVGSENLTSIAPQAMVERFNKVKLHGVLLNAAGDVGAETMRNIGVFKSVVAGDAIYAEHKGRDGFSFRPNVFNVASFNAMPATESNDSGFWDRWLVMQFEKRFNQGGKIEDTYWRDIMPNDPALQRGVLVKAVSALQRLRKRGGFDKSAFAEAKAVWREQVDSVANYVQHQLVLDEAGAVWGKGLYQHYRQGENETGGNPRGSRTFYKELENYLHEHHPGLVTHTLQKGQRKYRGFKVRVSEDGFMANHNETLGPQGWTSE